MIIILLLLMNLGIGKININTWEALRIAYDDYISTFNELMVRWIEYTRGH